MTTVDIRGFTIIELMLFLGITGALFAALMLGVNGNLTQQHYRDGVQSYVSLLQNEFSEVANTRNDRDDSWSCDNSVVAERSATPEARGTSSCVLLGRAIYVSDDGTSVVTSPIIGTLNEDASAAVVKGDLAVITEDYKPKIAQAFGTVKTNLDWGLNLKTTDGKTSGASFLIIRSPASGLIRVFASATPFPLDLSAYDLSDNVSTIVKNCVRGESGLLPTQSVSVDPRVAGPNGIVLKEVDPECA